MTQHNSLNVKLSNLQLNKVKSAIKNETEVVLRLSSNMIRDDETDFRHKLLSTNRQVANLRKAFANHLSTDRHHCSSSASHNTATLIISNNKIEDIIKIVKSFEDSGLSLKGVTETVQNEVKEKSGGFLIMFLGILGARLLENLLTGRGAITKRHGRGVNRAGKGRGINTADEEVLRAGYGNVKGRKNNKMDF